MIMHWHDWKCGGRAHDRDTALRRDRRRSLLAVLSKYIVLTGCRTGANVDLFERDGARPSSGGAEMGDPEHQRRHFDSETMIDMARSCDGILAGPPEIDLWDATSAHDLR